MPGHPGVPRASSLCSATGNCHSLPRSWPPGTLLSRCADSPKYSSAPSAPSASSAFCDPRWSAPATVDELTGGFAGPLATAQRHGRIARRRLYRHMVYWRDTMHPGIGSDGRVPDENGWIIVHAPPAARMWALPLQLATAVADERSIRYHR